TSEIKISCVIKKEKLDEAVRALHFAFMGHRAQEKRQ
ncbi:MAG: hypothetical protein AB1633_08205, partial [Elusimicrobiota bacterium]